MIEAIVFCVIAVAAIAAIFFGWVFYQKARDKERIYLIERGEKLSDILQAQKENRIRFVFPWSQLGIVTSSLSIAFIIIAFVIRYLENDQELFKGFIITSVIGLCLSVAFFIVNSMSKKKHH
tara:strand:+ start:116448 stop:116813 length:366 start_codon:yes stop_codon:yes gene_type:complete